jgi:hypothetical protein
VYPGAGERDLAMSITNNWRSSHGFPLQCLKMTLRSRAKRIDKNAIVAQRLKRLSSITVKLGRNKHMKLSQMQDLGGCRAILVSVPAVDRLVRLFLASTAKNPNVRPELIEKYDYIKKPKPDGYRGYHLVYRYRTASKERAVYNGHRIEIQIRTRLQHAWATAVETVSLFTGQALKSNVGTPAWKRFFALMASAIALRERRPLIPNTPTNKAELVKELRALTNELKVQDTLATWRVVVERLGAAKDAHTYLLTLDWDKRKLFMNSFKQTELAKASQEYLKVEAANALNPAIQAVLVSVESIGVLRSAYPNYYLDTTTFLAAVKNAIS